MYSFFFFFLITKTFKIIKNVGSTQIRKERIKLQSKFNVNWTRKYRNMTNTHHIKTQTNQINTYYLKKKKDIT